MILSINTRVQILVSRCGQRLGYKIKLIIEKEAIRDLNRLQ
jgi:hypothetical protein